MVVTFYFDPNITIPVKKYGGTERILYWLMKELVKKGNTIYFIGSKESKVFDIGVNLIPFDGGDWRTLIPKNTDIVQLFQNDSNVDFPSLNTIEGNEKSGIKFPLNTVFVSRNHALRHHSEHFIYNGIDIDEYPFLRNREFKNKNYLFLANARWNVKNLKDCIKASYSNKKYLFVAGGNIFDGISVFRENKTHRYLNVGLFYSFSPYIHYLGMLEQSKKLPLFKKIDALLWPVKWHEPFGIAVIETLSQGIPVFSSAYGSLPELIPEYCGRICSTYEEFDNVISQENMNFNSHDIRNYCIKNFSSSVMADNYLTYYERILSGEEINKTPPYSDNPENLLLPF